MNTKIISIAIILLLLAAGGYYLMNINISEDNAEADTNIKTPAREDATVSARQQGRGSLMSFLGLGESVNCTFSNTDTATGIVSSGEFYFDADSKRFRVNITTRDQNGTSITSMINDSEFSYVWSEDGAETFAMKMTADLFAPGTNTPAYVGSNQAENKQISLDAEVAYDCDSWRVDGGIFVPPAGIEFMDMASMMEDFQTSLPAGFDIPTEVPVSQ